MASPGELIKAVADVLHIPEVTVSSYYRNLREAGHVTKGGRGRSAPRMTANDAAQLLIAIGGSRFEKESAEKIVKDYSRIRVAHTARRMALPTDEPHSMYVGDWIESDAGTWIFDCFNIPHLQALPESHTFLDALVAVIVAAMAQEFGSAQHKNYPNTAVAHSIDVFFYGPEPRAGISVTFSGEGFSYEEQGTYLIPERVMSNPYEKPSFEENISHEYGSGDLEIRRKFTFRTIYEVAGLLKS